MLLLAHSFPQNGLTVTKVVFEWKYYEQNISADERLTVTKVVFEYAAVKSPTMNCSELALAVAVDKD